MSIIVTAEFHGQELKVEITRDLDMIFLDYDLEYDQAALEFGYPETDAVRLTRIWQSVPIRVVEENLVIPGMVRMLVACDWVEHVLPIFEKRSVKFVRYKPRMIVETIRRSLVDAIKSGADLESKHPLWGTGGTLVKLRDEAVSARLTHSGYHGYAAEQVARGAEFLASGFDTSLEVSSSAASAFSWYDPDPNIFPEADRRKPKLEAEFLWQIRRLVDVFGAMQAGEPLPPMEATP